MGVYVTELDSDRTTRAPKSVHRLSSGDWNWASTALVPQMKQHLEELKGSILMFVNVLMLWS